MRRSIPYVLAFFLWIQVSPAYPEIKTDVQRFTYASSYRNQDSEWRLHLSADYLKENKKELGYRFLGDIWGLFPRETSDWFDIREAWVRVPKMPLDLKVGRILLPWGGVEFHSPHQKIFPLFSVDALTRFRDGIVGFYASYRDSSHVLYEALFSPLFLPNRGGARYETKDAHFTIRSRWSLPLFYQVQIGEGWLPLDYTLHTPKVTDVLFHSGVAFRISREWSFFKGALLASHMMNPSPTLINDAKLYIKEESSVETRVHLYPRFFRMSSIGGEGALLLNPFSLLMETMVIRHQNPDLNPELNTLVGIRYDQKQGLIQTGLGGIVLSKELGPKKQTPLYQPEKPASYLFTEMVFHLFPAMPFSFSTESDLLFKEFVMTPAVTLSFLAPFHVKAGVSALVGEENTYWGSLRQHDRFWVEARYGF